METDLRTGDDVKASKIRITNRETKLVVLNASIIPVSNPEPSYILNCSNNINVGHISKFMTWNKIKEL